MSRETNEPRSSQTPDDLSELRKFTQNGKPGSPVTFGKYQLLLEIGRGGMGVVYKAYDTKLKAIVALKIILSQEREYIERFFLETSVIARLNHPNIVRFYECGNTPRPYFTMEFIEGVTLSHLIKERNIKPLQLVNIMIPLCGALHFAHKNKVMHRDIKPSNVIIAKDGTPKVMDFGLAKVSDATKQLSKSGQMMGTIYYMPPEQVEGKATYQSDIYSLGASIYEALTYRTVFQGEMEVNIICQIMDQYPIPLRQLNPDISPYLEAICLKCLQKNPRKRYSDFKQLEREFKNFAANRPIIAKKYTSWDVINHFISKHKIICSSIVLIFAILSTALGITLNALDYANEQRNKADKALKEKELVNNKLSTEKQKTEEANQDLTSLNKAIIKSLAYAKKADSYKYIGLFQNTTFLNPLQKLFRQSVRLQTAQEYTFLRGLILGQSKQKTDILQAIEDYTKEIEAKPRSPSAYNNRGLLYEKQGKHGLAERDFTLAIRHKTNYTNAYYNRGNLYYKQQKYNLAVKDFNTAIALDPKNELAYRNRGVLYLKQKKYKKVVLDWERAILFGYPKAELQPALIKIKRLIQHQK